MYRPLLAGKVTMSELKTIVTCEDLYEINAVLDMEYDIKLHQEREQERKRK